MKHISKIIACFTVTASLLLTGCEGFFDILFDSLGRELVDYTTVEYVRPDYDALKADIEECKDKLENGKYVGKDGKNKLHADMEHIVDAYYYKLLTMSEVAFLNYCQDITDGEARDEYYDIYSQVQVISALLDELYSVCADSDHAEYLESTFLGEGFLLSYSGEYSVPDGLIELYTEETELIKKYGETMSDMSVDYNGKTYSYDEIPKIYDDRLYESVCDAFLDKYNKELGDVYVELVSVRKEIARICGYGSYAEYAYESAHGREYSPSQADEYVSDVKKYITPVYIKHKLTASEAEYLLPDMSPEDVVLSAEKLLGKMSSDLSKIYKEMINKKLYTVSSSEKMYYGSFQTYLNDYESPYLFVNGNGTGADILTLLHEFGHFSSSYYNFGSTGSNDESEVASQALELIGSMYCDSILGQADAEAIKTYELYYILLSINECAAWTAFENLAYADEDLTLEECNEYFARCSVDFGLTDNEGDDVRDWVLINHIVEYPYYVIGYSVSADVALQLYELENEKQGRGISTYISFIKLASNNDFFGNLEKAKLVSPFSSGRSEKLALIIDKELCKMLN